MMLVTLQFTGRESLLWLLCFNQLPLKAAVSGLWWMGEEGGQGVA